MRSKPGEFLSSINRSRTVESKRAHQGENDPAPAAYLADRKRWLRGAAIRAAILGMFTVGLAHALGVIPARLKGGKRPRDFCRQALFDYLYR